MTEDITEVRADSESRRKIPWDISPRKDDDQDARQRPAQRPQGQQQGQHGHRKRRHRRAHQQNNQQGGQQRNAQQPRQKQQHGQRPQRFPQQQQQPRPTPVFDRKDTGPGKKRMTITFYGAAGEVGRSCIMVESGHTRLILDAGIKLGEHEEHPVIDDSMLKDVDAVILSHAHLDHCGYVPPPLLQRLRRPGLRHEAYARARERHNERLPLHIQAKGRDQGGGP